MINLSSLLKFVLLAAILMVAAPISAQDYQNGVFRFLNVPTTPYSGSLALPVVSIPEKTISLIHLNPAYLDSSDHKKALFSYTNYFADISLTDLTVGWNLKKYGMFATSIRYMSYGEFTKRDELGVDMGNFTAYDLALSGHFSKYVTEKLNWGVTTTFIISAIDQAQSTGIAVSSGLNYILNEYYSLGITILNVGSQLTTYGNTYEKIPFSINAGLSHRLKYMPFRYSLTVQQLNNWQLKTIYEETNPDFITNLLRHGGFSGEFLFTESFNFRFGYNRLLNESLRTDTRVNFSGTSFGVGIKTGYADFDFSRSSFSSLGSVYQIAIKTQF